MALNPEVQFAGKIAASSVDYPYGEARDVTTPGDGTGTPLVAALVNDIFGFQQKLLSAAGIVPSGDPDTVTASQYFQALQKLINSPPNTEIWTGSAASVNFTTDINGGVDPGEGWYLIGADNSFGVLTYTQIYRSMTVATYNTGRVFEDMSTTTQFMAVDITAAGVATALQVQIGSGSASTVFTDKNIEKIRKIGF